MDRAAFFFTEVRMELGVVHVELASSKEIELMYGESECPRDVGPVEWGRFNLFWGFLGFSSAGVRHGIVFKLLNEWSRL